MRPCLFCGITQPLTREHVFPDWIRKSGRRPSEGVEQSSVLPRPLRVDCYTWRLKVMCKICNNEWGSALEQAAQPSLEMMIEGQVVQLAPPAQESLAKWAYKTALVAWHGLGSPAEKRVSAAFCAALRKGLAPSEGSMRVGTNRLAVQQRPIREFRASGASRLVDTVGELEHFVRTHPQLDTNGQAVAQTVIMGLGRAFFMINIGLVVSHWNDLGELIWLYPASGQAIKWPTREMGVEIVP